MSNVNKSDDFSAFHQKNKPPRKRESTDYNVSRGTDYSNRSKKSPE